MMFQAGTTSNFVAILTSIQACRQNVPLMAIAQANWEVEANGTVSTERVFNKQLLPRQLQNCVCVCVYVYVCVGV